MHRFLFSTSLQKTVLRAGAWDGNKESPLSKGSRHAKIGPLTHEVLFFQIWSFWKPLETIVHAPPVSQRILPRTAGKEQQKEACLAYGRIWV